MKTATVTWIKHYNYGTYLQAYALQKAICKLGYENDIISDFNIQQMEPSKNSFIKKNINRILHLSRTIDNYKYKKIDLKRLQHYVEFKEKYMSVTDPVIEEQLNLLNEKYDTFICGSDQIWAPNKEVFHEFYYLAFADNDKKKISYAPSLGLNNFQVDTNKIKKLVERFNKVSVREESGKQLLEQITDKQIDVVLDPTLLLKQEEWDEVAKTDAKKDYIFCYFLGENDWYYDLVRKLAKERNCDILTIPTKPVQVKRKGIILLEDGPSEFIGHIKNASMVITDSFHGTIFSILYQKEFLVLKRFQDTEKNCQNSRIYNLLNKLKIENRFVNEGDVINLTSLNYEKINDLLDKERIKSIQFLSGSLGGKNGK